MLESSAGLNYEYMLRRHALQHQHRIHPSFPLNNQKFLVNLITTQMVETSVPINYIY